MTRGGAKNRYASWYFDLILTYETVPCLRRATSLAYTDADEDAERLVSFAEGGSKDKDDEWVETHTGRSELHKSKRPLLSF